MGHTKQFSVVLLVLMLGHPTTGLYAGQRSENGELALKYPGAPKVLDGDPTVSAVLLVDLDFKGLVMRLQGLDGAALAKSDSDALRRAAPMKGKLVLFDALESGTYALRLIKVSNGNAKLLFNAPTIPELTLSVAPGEIRYVGAVEVTKPVGFDPVTFQVNYDAKRELEALSELKKKYPSGRWNALADSKIQSLKSTGNSQRRPQ